MTEEQKRELLGLLNSVSVELREMSESLSEDLLRREFVLEGAGAAGKGYAAMFGVN
jgi:hypothetical protein